MDHELLVIAGIALLLLGACTATPPTDEANPLLADWDTPFGAPPFDDIRPEHFEPAFTAAMAAHADEVAAIAAGTDEPTFANTIEALERSGEELMRVRAVFTNLNAAHTNPELQALAKTVNPALAAHRDDILLNQELFVRVKAVFDARAGLELSREQQRLLEKTYRRFVRGGADLDDAAQARLRELNGELSSLTTQFGENLLKHTNAVALLIEDEADLVGLPQSVRDAASALAEANGHAGAWAFNLQRTSWTPFLQYAENRDLRRRLATAYVELAGADNAPLASRIAALRAERAAVLGYESHAHYQLEENMAEAPQRVNELLEQLWTPALARAEAERAEMEQLARSEGAELDLELWDWWYYAEKLRTAKYAFDEESVKPYLELESVRAAAFDVATRLFGLRFTERTDIPIYHPDVRAWEVTEADGAAVGLFYTDYFARESKRGGAWMDNYRQQWRRQDGTDVRPIVVNVCNFSKPSAGQPALLSLDEAATLFHEFGHALHGLLADGAYVSMSGTSVAQDFVELPSQMMENWALAPEYLATYATHVDTGEPIPEDLVAKLQRARQFNQGFATTEYLAASILDMKWHGRTATDEVDAGDFEAEAMKAIGIIDEIAPRYRSTYFAHIFSGGYSAGYYSYVWAEVLDADGFEAFREQGLFDPDLAAAFRTHILEAGDSEAPMELYRRFRGSDPSIDALLARRGLS
jgi:peptidyl-dipeptidase Dcp